MHNKIGYNLPSTKTSWGAGFGIGDRFKNSRNSTNSKYDTWIINLIF